MTHIHFFDPYFAGRQKHLEREVGGKSKTGPREWKCSKALFRSVFESSRDSGVIRSGMG
jgi:hypothetical protein